MIMEEVLRELRVQNKLLALLCQAKVGYSGNAGDSPEKKLDNPKVLKFWMFFTNL